MTFNIIKHSFKLQKNLFGGKNVSRDFAVTAIGHCQMWIYWESFMHRLRERKKENSIEVSRKSCAS